MAWWILAFVGALLAGCAVRASGERPAADTPLPKLGQAPEILSPIWINTPALRPADLRGQVVLVEFWTFGCVNCQNVIPSIRNWHDRYGARGLTVIGVHYPEFDYEADLENLKNAVARFDIRYAVAQDNEARTWNAYGVRFWPTLYLIDKTGEIRYRHIGEGAYEETEAAIKKLLEDPSSP